MRAAAAAVADAGVDAWASERLGAARAERLRAPGRRSRRPALLRPHRHRPGRETFHIGRRHVRDAAGDPVVIDWRAPMSRPFYQASAVDPQGLRAPPPVRLRRRRAHRLRGRAARPPATSTTSRFLREEIERPAQRARCATSSPPSSPTRTTSSGRRWPSRSACRARRAPARPRSACTGPPTCSTRTAGSWPASGVLVVGPNRAFLRYIEEVLPTLGEVDVDQTTVAGLTARVPVRAVDRPEVAVLKGDARMAEVLRRALWGEIAKPADSIQVPLAGRKYRVTVERLKRYVDDVRRRGRADDDQQLLHYAAGRERLAMLVAEDARRQKEEAGGSPTDAETRKAARSAEVRAFCDEVWPARDAAGAGRTTCWTDPARLARAARGVLDRRRAGAAALADAAAVGAQRARGPRPTPCWSTRSPGLLDRTPGLRARRASTRRRTSRPMQCRAVARRLAAGSLTVLGDLAQATSPWSPSDWQETLAGLGRPDTVVRPLTRGYRVPGEVLDFANRLLPLIAPGLPAATAVRSRARVAERPAGGRARAGRWSTW